MKYAFLSTFIFLSMGFGFNLSPVETEDLPAGVYYAPLPTTQNPTPAPRLVSEAKSDSIGSYEKYLSSIFQSKVEYQSSTHNTPLLNSLKIYCSDRYFQGEEASRVTKGEWINCMTQITSLIKKEASHELLVKLLEELIISIINQWHADAANFVADSRAKDPLGLGKENIKVTVNFNGPVERVDLKLRLKLYQKERYFVSRDVLESYLKTRKGPLPASK